MARFEVRGPSEDVRGRPRWLVVNLDDDARRPVAEFDDRTAAEEHAAKLNDGPLDLDEQEQWQDPWHDDDWSSE